MVIQEDVPRADPARARRLLVRVAAEAAVLVLLVVAAFWWWRASAPAQSDLSRVEETSMPSREQLAEVARTRVLFAHNSVGMNIIDGVGRVYAAEGVEAPKVVEVSTDGGAPTGVGGALTHAYVGVNGDPMGKLTAFEKLVDGPAGDGVDVALLKLCYVDFDAHTDVETLFAAYETMMAGVEARHPDVTFLYATVPLTADPPRTPKELVKHLLGRGDTGPVDNAVRERYNELVRDRFGPTGRVFDVAAVEATMATQPLRRTNADGEVYYVLHGRMTSDGKHLNALGSRIVGAELIREIADNLS